MIDNTSPSKTPLTDSTTSTTRTTIGVFAVAALGLAGAGLLTTQLADSDASLSGSLNGVPYALAQAVDEAEANRAATEVIQLTSISDAGGDESGSDDNIMPLVDEVTDTVGDIAATVGDKLIEVGKCLLDQLPDVFSSANETGSVDAAVASPCADLLPGADDFGGVDLSLLDLDDLDLSTIDLSTIDLDSLEIGDFDPADFGLPTDFDLSDIDLGGLSDFELPDIGDLETSDLDLGNVEFGTEVLEVVSDVTEQVIEFFEELPGDLRDRFDGLFGD